jgi:TctA family transporter
MDLLQTALTSLQEVLAWPAIGYLGLGMLIGLVVGILPGLGATVTMAIMLPFTFGMTPIQAFVFLLGMYSVTLVAGDITSILFGVPGEPTSTAVVIDGHPMAKAGEGGRALGAAFASSLVGALIGAVVLFLMLPVVLPVTRSFGTPEFFMLAVLGLTFVGGVSGNVPVKGLAMAAFGMLLATVGQDPQLGQERYTFGTIGLLDGLSIVPVTVGLYALPEIAELAVTKGSIARSAASKIGGLVSGLRDTLQHWALVLRTSILGTIVGAVPGLGGVVAQWIAYGHAVQSAKDKSRFGQGDVRGVLGPCAAGNSKEGGNLLTVTAFGIPSTATMSILLGAFLIHGLVPGPAMLTTNLNVTLSMVWVIIIAHVVAVVVCALFIKQLVRITQVRGTLLVAPLIMLVFIGSYTESNHFSDLIVTIVFGVVGIIMVKLDWPRPPLILGLILGPLMERNLSLGLQAYGLEMFQRPIVVVLMIASLTAVFFPILKRRLARRGGKVASSSIERARESAPE